MEGEEVGVSEERITRGAVTLVEGGGTGQQQGRGAEAVEGGGTDHTDAAGDGEVAEDLGVGGLAAGKGKGEVVVPQLAGMHLLN